MKKIFIIGIFSSVAILILLYIFVLFNPPATNQFFGWNIYQIAIQRDTFIMLLPYFYILFLVVLVGCCFLFGKEKQITKKIYWVTTSIILPILLIYIGLISDCLPYGPTLTKKSAVTKTLKQLAQNLDIREKDMIITDLNIYVQNIPIQRPIKIIVSVRNVKTKQDDTYQHPAKLSLSRWGIAAPSNHETSSARDARMKDIKLGNLPEILRDTKERQKSLARYHSGICSVELDTRNLYWRVNVQNVSGEIAYTYVYSVDGEYIIRLSS